MYSINIIYKPEISKEYYKEISNKVDEIFLNINSNKVLEDNEERYENNNYSKISDVIILLSKKDWFLDNIVSWTLYNSKKNTLEDILEHYTGKASKINIATKHYICKEEALNSLYLDITKKLDDPNTSEEYNWAFKEGLKWAYLDVNEKESIFNNEEEIIYKKDVINIIYNAKNIDEILFKVQELSSII